MSQHRYVFFAVLIAAIATFGLRAFPFALMKIAHRHEHLFRYLGEVMPPGIMAILSVYCISTLYWQTPAKAGVSLAALAVLFILEHIKRQLVLSICAALAVYAAGQSLIAGGVL